MSSASSGENSTPGIVIVGYDIEGLRGRSSCEVNQNFERLVSRCDDLVVLLVRGGRKVGYVELLGWEKRLGGEE